MNNRINKTRTILLLLIDKEINLSFSSNNKLLKINSIDPKELTKQFTDALYISFTNPITTNSSTQSSSANLLLLRKSISSCLYSKAKKEKTMIFTRKVAVSRMKLVFTDEHEQNNSKHTSITKFNNVNKYKKYEETYIKCFHYLFNLAYSILPKVKNDNLERKTSYEHDDFNSEDEKNIMNNSDIVQAQYEEHLNYIHFIEKEIKQYVYNEDYDDDSDFYSTQELLAKQHSLFQHVILHPMN